MCPPLPPHMPPFPPSATEPNPLKPTQSHRLRATLNHKAPQRGTWDEQWCLSTKSRSWLSRKGNDCVRGATTGNDGGINLVYRQQYACLHQLISSSEKSCVTSSVRGHSCAIKILEGGTYNREGNISTVALDYLLKGGNFAFPQKHFLFFFPIFPIGRLA